MISQYMKAGFMPHAGCNLQAATEFVQFHMAILIMPGIEVEYKEEESRFYVGEYATEWYWENGHLLRRIGTDD